MTALSSPISYPSFAEFIRERFRGERASTIAARCDAEEQTVIAWSSGTMPGKQLWERIERELGYQFAERRFADAVAVARFPPADAPEEIRSIRTHAALVMYLAAVVKRVTQRQLAAFFEWPASSMSHLTTHPRHVFELDALARLLSRLPELPKHLRGEIISPCTPPALIGVMLRECRQQRGERLRPYAARIGISPSYLQYLEEVGRGRGVSGDPVRASSVRNADTAETIIVFLTREREELGLRSPPPTPPAPKAQNHAALVPPAGDPAVVVARLAAFVRAVGNQREAGRRLGIAQSTIRDILKRGKLRPKIAARISAALDAADSSMPVLPTPLPVPAPHSAVPRSVEERLAMLEATVADLVARSRTAYVSPLSAVRFQHRSESVSDAELLQHRERIRAAAESLGALASVTDDALRLRIQTEITPDVDELFITMEGFLREYPSASLETLDTMRRFAAAHRERARAHHPA